MAKSLIDYIAFLHGRGDTWPTPPAIDPPRAKAAIQPFPGIRAVLWNVYGTLIRVSDGELLQEHPQRLRMQVALEKTVDEFSMWNAMFRTEQLPWEYMEERWLKARENHRLTTGTAARGDVPALDSSRLWRTIVDELLKKDFTWDESIAEDADAIAGRIAYFFHARLQGFALGPGVRLALEAIADSGIRQGLLADTQPFTVPQLLYLLGKEGTEPGRALLDPALTVQSHAVGCAKPSPTLFQAAIDGLAGMDISPAETLVVGTRVAGDLGPAKRHGFRTALYAGDKLAVRIRASEVRNPAVKPDRLLTDLAQIREILRIP